MHFNFTSSGKTLTRQAAFSLLELLIVIALLGLTAIVVTPKISTSNNSKLDLAAEEIAQAMRFARSEAIRTGLPHGFTQQSLAKRIRVSRTNTTTVPWKPIYDVYHPISKKIYDIDLDIHQFAEADNLSSTRIYRDDLCINNKRRVYFDAKGTPWCTDPETVLLQRYEVTLTLGNHTRVVKLHQVTGRVTVQ